MVKSYNCNHDDCRGLPVCHFTILPFCHLLKLRILRCPWEGNHIPDVRHAGHKEDEPLKAETEAGVRGCAEFPGIEVPPHILFGDIHFMDPL